MSFTLTLYTKPACVQCDQTKRLIKRDKHPVAEEIDVTESADALAYIKDLGYLQAPVVVQKDTDGNVLQHWSGFRPDILATL